VVIAFRNDFLHPNTRRQNARIEAPDLQWLRGCRKTILQNSSIFVRWLKPERSTAFFQAKQNAGIRSLASSQRRKADSFMPSLLLRGNSPPVSFLCWAQAAHTLAFFSRSALPASWWHLEEEQASAGFDHEFPLTLGTPPYFHRPEMRLAGSRNENYFGTKVMTSNDSLLITIPQALLLITCRTHTIVRGSTKQS